MLSCRELVNETTGDPDLITPGHSLRWSVRLHLLMCRHCRCYVRQLRLLLTLLSGRHRQPAAEADTVDRIWQAVQNRQPPLPRE